MKSRNPPGVCLTYILPVALLCAVAGSRADSVWYWEKFAEFPYGVTDDGYIDELDWHGRVRLAGSFDWNGTVDISTFDNEDEQTWFYVWLADQDGNSGTGYGGGLDEDPHYKPGNRSVRLPLYHYGYDDEIEPDGSLWIQWNEKGFRFILAGKTHDYSDLETGLGLGFRRNDPGAFTNTAVLEVGFGTFEKKVAVPIVGVVSRYNARWTDPEYGDVYDYTITSMVLGGPSTVEPQQEEPRWLRRRIKIPRIKY
jgi:hypothetical protein